VGVWKLLKIKNKIKGRSECSLASVNSKLYLIGGDDLTEQFDPNTFTWTKSYNSGGIEKFSRGGPDEKI
jgi:hypothetical protein